MTECKGAAAKNPSQDPRRKPTPIGTRAYQSYTVFRVKRDPSVSPARGSADTPRQPRCPSGKTADPYVRLHRRNWRRTRPKGRSELCGRPSEAKSSALAFPGLASSRRERMPLPTLRLRTLLLRDHTGTGRRPGGLAPGGAAGRLSGRLNGIGCAVRREGSCLVNRSDNRDLCPAVYFCLLENGGSPFSRRYKGAMKALRTPFYGNIREIVRYEVEGRAVRRDNWRLQVTKPKGRDSGDRRRGRGE